MHDIANAVNMNNAVDRGNVVNVDGAVNRGHVEAISTCTGSLSTRDPYLGNIQHRIYQCLQERSI